MAQTPELKTWLDEVWNNANEQYMHDTLHPEAIVHGLHTDADKLGISAFLPFYQNFRGRFPTTKVIFEPILNCDGYQAAQCHFTLTDKDGNTGSLIGLTIARFKDGKLTEGWNGFDFLALYKQLGYSLMV